MYTSTDSKMTLRQLKIILFLIAIHLVSVAASHSCPTWFKELEPGNCVCEVQLSRLNCDPLSKNVSIFSGFCLTISDDGTEIFGDCPYNANAPLLTFFTLPQNVSQLNEVMCGPLNRTGVLCSQCKPGLGPAVFSYYRECKECLDYPYGWILFFVRLFVSLTLFCIVVIAFRINVASPYCNGLLIAVQLLNNIVSNNPFIAGQASSYSFSSFVIDLYGFLSLDFFNNLIPSFCISEEISMPAILALEYLVALYPILFTAAVYSVIVAHDSGCRVLVVCWRPFHKCFVKVVWRPWGLKGSVINAFSTFILLSYCKFCTISLRLSQRIPMHYVFGDTRNIRDVLYFDANYDTHSIEYKHYQALALFVGVMITLPAFFLLFYQFRTVQRCLHCCRIRCTLLHEMANILQGCFKNGTTPGTRDYRWFAGLYFLLRLLIIFFINQQYHLLVYLLLSGAMSVIVAALRPYRLEWGNNLDVFFWLLFLFATSFYVFNLARTGNIIWNGMMYIVVCVPLLYSVCLFVWIIAVSAYKWCRSQCKKRTAPEQDDNQLPDRIVNPNEYTPLILPVH